MSTIINSLHEFVTPVVLQLTQAHQGSDDNKKDALSVIYGWFASRLTDETVANKLLALSDDEQKDGEKILSIISTDESVNQGEFLGTLRHIIGEKFSLPSETVGELSAAGLPLAFAHLKSLAGSRPVYEYVAEDKEGFLSFLPAWFVGLLPAGLLGAFAALGGGVSNVVGGVAQTASNLAHGAVDAVSDVAGSVGKVAGQAVDGVAGVAGSVVDGVGSVASGAAGLAGKAVGGAADVAGKAVDGVSEGVGKAAGAIGSELKDLKDGVSSAVGSASSSGGGFAKTMLPIVGALIVAGLGWMMLKGCQKEPTQVAAPAKPTAEVVAPDSTVAATPVALSAATLALGLNETGDKLFNCQGVTGAGLGEQWKAAIAGVFSGDCQFETKEGIETKSPVTSQTLSQILGFMKGVPDATVSVNDKTVRLNSSNPEALQKLLSDVKTAFPDLTVEAEPALNVEEAVKNSIDAAKSALDGMGEGATIDDLVRALNLQIINFASGSANIPADNQAVLDKAAERLQALSDAKLLITGHTDSQGKFESNQTLSESRAKAVHDYLVAKGVSDDKLEIKGASSSNPVATNATEQGRFANRRIEFTVFKDGEVVAKVGDTAATSSEVKAEEPKAEEAKTESSTDKK